MKYLFIGMGTLLFGGAVFAQTNQSTFSNVVKPSSECKVIVTPQVFTPVAVCPPGAYVVSPANGAELSRIGRIIEGKQRTNQWSPDRYAILIPQGPQGTYDMEAPFSIGYYTQILGLGDKPEDVSISPGVQVLNDPVTNNGLNNFWRSIENFSMKFKRYPVKNHTGSTAEVEDNLRYAVSQASPIRRIHFISDKTIKFLLCDWDTPDWGCGYTSGGFMADSQIDGTLSSGSQQQWFMRNSTTPTWEGGVWNMIFLGNSITEYPKIPSPPPTLQQPAGDSPWDDFPRTVLEKTPLIREKPYLICSNCKNGELALDKMKWQVVVPGLKQKSTGTNSANDSDSTKIDVEDNFFIVQPPAQSDNMNDLVSSINKALIDGKNLIFMPGVYKLPGQIAVPPPRERSENHRRIILGLGLPTLVCEGTTPCIQIDDEQGVLLGGIMFEAGTQAPNLLVVGKSVSTQDNSSNPNFLYDIYCRVAKTKQGAPEPKTDTCITINANDVVGDNLWLWRGDHDIERSGNNAGNLVKWNQNIAEHGLIVNGSRVTMYGLAVEHFRDQQTVWNGEDGHVYFYQSEMPYTLPDDENARKTWLMKKHSASYVIGENVKKHTAYGLGVYTYFPDQKNEYTANVMAETAILLPYEGATNDINVTHAVGSWLDGNTESGFKHLIQNYSGKMCWGLQAKGPHGGGQDLPVIASFDHSPILPCSAPPVKK